MINQAIEKILNKENLDFVESKECFDEVFQGLSGEILATSFISMLKMKEETIDEISGAIVSFGEANRKISIGKNEDNIIQNVFFETSQSKKYFNFAFVNDLMCSASGLISSDYSFENPLFWALKDKFQIFDKLDFNIQDANNLDFEETNYVLLKLKNDIPNFKYSSEIFLNLNFKTILNYAFAFFNPTGAKNLYFGLDDKSDVNKLAQIALKLGYSNSIVVAGSNNLPFVTPFGSTFVAEAWKNKIFTYELSPSLLDFSEHDKKEIEIENKEEFKELFFDLIENKLGEKNAIFETCVINSALALYISKKADSLMEGIDLAKKTIKDGLLKEKFYQIKRFYS